MKVPATRLVEVQVARKEPSGIGRSLVKTITYRVVSAVAVVALAWAMFGSIKTAGAFALFDAVVATVLYFAHERVWARYDIRTREEA